MTGTIDTEGFRATAHLKQLRVECNTIERAITALLTARSADQVALRRLRKRRLVLREQIAHMESDLIPDLNA